MSRRVMGRERAYRELEARENAQEDEVILYMHSPSSARAASACTPPCKVKKYAASWCPTPDASSPIN